MARHSSTRPSNYTPGLPPHQMDMPRMTSRSRPLSPRMISDGRLWLQRLPSSIMDTRVGIDHGPHLHKDCLGNGAVWTQMATMESSHMLIPSTLPPRIGPIAWPRPTLAAQYWRARRGHGLPIVVVPVLMATDLPLEVLHCLPRHMLLSSRW